MGGEQLLEGCITGSLARTPTDHLSAATATCADAGLASALLRAVGGRGALVGGLQSRRPRPVASRQAHDPRCCDALSARRRRPRRRDRGRLSERAGGVEVGRRRYQFAVSSARCACVRDCRVLGRSSDPRSLAGTPPGDVGGRIAQPSRVTTRRLPTPFRWSCGKPSSGPD